MEEKVEQNDLQVSRHHITNSVAVLLFRLIAVILLVEAGYMLLLFLAGTSLAENHYSVTINLLWIAQIIKFLIETGLVFVVAIAWAGVSYYLTDTHLIRYTGVYRRDETVYDMSLLKTVELHQSWLGRLFNFGDLRLVFSSSGYLEKVVMMDIYNPKKYERVLRAKLHGDES